MSEKTDIKLTVGMCVSFLNNQEFINETLKVNMPRKTSYWLGRVITKMNVIFKEYRKQQNKIIEEFAVKDDKGKPIIKDEKTGSVDFGDNEKKAVTQLNELLAIEESLGINRLELDPEDLPEFSATDWVIVEPFFMEMEEC